MPGRADNVGENATSKNAVKVIRLLVHVHVLPVCVSTLRVSGSDVFNRVNAALLRFVWRHSPFLAAFEIQTVKRGHAEHLQRKAAWRLSRGRLEYCDRKRAF